MFNLLNAFDRFYLGIIDEAKQKFSVFEYLILPFRSFGIVREVPNWPHYNQSEKTIALDIKIIEEQLT